jgi:hypothetical protein
MVPRPPEVIQWFGLLNDLFLLLGELVQSLNGVLRLDDLARQLVVRQAVALAPAIDLLPPSFHGLLVWLGLARLVERQDIAEDTLHVTYDTQVDRHVLVDA